MSDLKHDKTNNELSFVTQGIKISNLTSKMFSSLLIQAAGESREKI